MNETRPRFIDTGRRIINVADIRCIIRDAYFPKYIDIALKGARSSDGSMVAFKNEGVRDREYFLITEFLDGERTFHRLSGVTEDASVPSPASIVGGGITDEAGRDRGSLSESDKR